MWSFPLVSVEKYLRTSYRPDCDYVDGVVEQRNLGELDHAWIQRNLVAFFDREFRRSGIVAIAEWRFQTRPTRYRIPDVVLTSGKPKEQILRQSPLLCIEVLSLEDTVKRTNARIQEYLDLGVPAVWLIDPETKALWIYRLNGIEKVVGGSVKVDGTSIEVPLSEIFD